MQTFKNQKVPVKIISPNDGAHYFFGYYDMQPYDKSGRYHLAHRTRFINRLPEADDECEVGVIDTETGRFESCGRTTAWNFQQGAMLRWYDENSILYNVRTADGFGAAITDIHTKRTRYLPMPTATARPEAGVALSINFRRIYDFRPGYGYAGEPDKFEAVNAPADDGIFLMDLRTGETKLIVPYTKMLEAFPQEPYSSCKVLVNHITLNPAGDRFIFLLRNFRSAENDMWNTQMLCCDLEGNLTKLTDWQFNSHYHWKDNDHLVIVSDWQRDDWGLVEFDVRDGSCEQIDCPGLKGRDIHCIYSPDKRYILGDGYPLHGSKYRPLFVLDREKVEFYTLVDVLSLGDAQWDARSDLHARWTPDGKKISFDSTHTGDRTICEIKIDGFLD